jgi:hypothetical protein
MGQVRPLGQVSQVGPVGLVSRRLSPDRSHLPYQPHQPNLPYPETV